MATAGRQLRASSSRTSSGTNQLLRSIYEGWAFHFTPESRKWMRRWLVVDGSRLVVFASDRNNSSQAVVVSLNLGQGTKVKDISLQPNVYGLDIELTTLKGSKESRTDFFGFSTPNECDLWKAYILGFSYGVVPGNLNLLPGQLKDVHEAIMDNGLAPPPLPSLHHKRPLLQNVLPQMMQQRPTHNTSAAASDPFSRQLSSSSAVISPYSEISSSQPDRNQMVDLVDGVFEEDGESDVLEQLEQRRKELAMKALEKEVERLPSNHDHHGAPVQMTVRSPFAQMRPQPTWNQSQPVLMSSNDSVRIATHRVSLPKLRTALPITNNNELPPFYDDPEKNKVAPSWFISCDREMAEMILTGARSCGNLFMRPSFNINASETYVISMRRDLPGGLELRHYAVHRTTDGFKLDVVDKHSPMSCLSDVMSFFTNYVGPSAQALNSQDVERIFGSSVPSASIFSPRPDSSTEGQLLLRTDSSSLENEVRPGEDNNHSANDDRENKESQRVATTADGRLDESLQLLHINEKNKATASNHSTFTQQQEAASMSVSDQIHHLNNLTSEDKVDPSTCC